MLPFYQFAGLLCSRSFSSVILHVLRSFRHLPSYAPKMLKLLPYIFSRVQGWVLCNRPTCRDTGEGMCDVTAGRKEGMRECPMPRWGELRG
jgi:hypothetical protein